jgi:hypothetical protein
MKWRDYTISGLLPRCGHIQARRPSAGIAARNMTSGYPIGDAWTLTCRTTPAKDERNNVVSNRFGSTGEKESKQMPLIGSRGL